LRQQEDEVLSVFHRRAFNANRHVLY
jgi:hypothetical protein